MAKISRLALSGLSDSPLIHDIAIRVDASSQPLLNFGLDHSEKGACGVKGTVEISVFEVITVGLSEGTGLGVVFGSGVNPGSVTVLVIGVSVDFRAINKIKIPAPIAVNTKTTYKFIFFILKRTDHQSLFILLYRQHSFNRLTGSFSKFGIDGYLVFHIPERLV